MPFKYANITQNTFREGRAGGCREIKAENYHHQGIYFTKNQNQLWTQLPKGKQMLIVDITTASLNQILRLGNFPLISILMLCCYEVFLYKVQINKGTLDVCQYRLHWEVSTRLSNEIKYFPSISFGKYYMLNICILIIITFWNLNYEFSLLNPQQSPIHILYPFPSLFFVNGNYVLELLCSYGTSRVFLILHDWNILILSGKLNCH